MNSNALIGGRFMFKKNPLQDFLSSLNVVITINESSEFITGHVIYNQAYIYKFQLKTTIIHCKRLKTFSLLSNLKCRVAHKYLNDFLKMGVAPKW